MLSAVMKMFKRPDPFDEIERWADGVASAPDLRGAVEAMSSRAPDFRRGVPGDARTAMVLARSRVASGISDRLGGALALPPDEASLLLTRARLLCERAGLDETARRADAVLRAVIGGGFRIRPEDRDASPSPSPSP